MRGVQEPNDVERRNANSFMSVKPIEYARPDLPGDDPIRSAPTTTGFYIEVMPRPVKAWIHAIIASVVGAIVVAVAFAIPAGLVGVIIIVSLLIWVVERSMAQRNGYASLELDGHRFVVHHGGVKRVYPWMGIERFEHMRFDDGTAAVVAVVNTQKQHELYRSNRDSDVEQIVRILNDEKKER